eukprot:Filipodium_phascolosomae@DN2010_c0_g1_i1.p1
MLSKLVNTATVGRRALFQSLAKRCISVEAMKMNTPLAQMDPEMDAIIKREQERQKHNIVLIASENFQPQCVLDCLSSVMANKYSEGYPGARYYGGNEFIDQSESLCIKRALEAFRLDPSKWGVNVQALSGSPCNFEAYTACLQPHDRILSLALPHGGHLSHGHQVPGKKISAVSTYFEQVAYRCNTETGLIDYDEMAYLAERFRPKLIVAGTSSYARAIDYPRVRQIADANGALVLADMAHISGLVAADVVPSPFELCDIVTTTTHKTLRGPRGAMIFFRRGQRGVDKAGNPIMWDMEEKVNSSVFPGHQGGPHNHTIAALAAALKMTMTPEYKEYQTQVLRNSQALAAELMARDFKIVSGGTDNHLCLIDLRNKGLSGSKVEKICDALSITLNRNTIPADVSALNPNGVRVGAPAMTSRGLVEADFKEIARFIDEGIQVAQEIQKETGKKLSDFEKHLMTDPPSVQKLRGEIQAFASAFPNIGF